MKSKLQLITGDSFQWFLYVLFFHKALLSFFLKLEYKAKRQLKRGKIETGKKENWEYKKERENSNFQLSLLQIQA